MKLHAGWLVLVLAGCTPSGGTAKALIHGTADGSKIAGTATFTETSAGLKMVVQVANVPPGPHAFHIHEHGSCGDGGKAAGGHYNPDGVRHGFLPKDGFTGAHAGDFGNLDVGPNGLGTLTLILPGLTLREGPHAIAGKAVVLHEKRDEFSQPTGNAGGRIGCGLILTTNN